MTVRLTAAQARQLNLPDMPKAMSRRKVRDRTTVPDRECARNVCHVCGEVQAGETAEDASRQGHRPRPLRIHPDVEAVVTGADWFIIVLAVGVVVLTFVFDRLRRMDEQDAERREQSRRLLDEIRRQP